MDINEILNNPNNMYYGHGTGTENPQVIASIIKNGLRCSHGSLYYTTVALGIGTKIENSEKEMMKKWPHKGSNIVVVVSLPLKYKIIESSELGTYNMADAAFYYTPYKDTREQESLSDSPYVIPEFVVGYYDAVDDSFSRNPRYYENLSQEEQNELFKQVKQNYFNVVEDGCGIEKYQGILTDLGYDSPLTPDEVIAFKRNKATQELLSTLGEEMLSKQVLLPDGNKTTADKYIKEMVLPFLPATGYVVLANGNQLPVSHFIIECVLYDCQERYNGNFSKYMQENVNIEETVRINSINKTDEHKKR